jgi:hypothetical protein
VLIAYDVDTRRIVGYCGRVLDTGGWREPDAAEVFGDRDVATLLVGEMAEAMLFRYGQENLRLTFDDAGNATGVEVIPGLRLRCDVDDTDGDGIPDLPADGVSSTLVTARVTDRKAGIEVAFRTTRGSLAARTVLTDDDGEASVYLRSVAETVATTVTATALGYRPGSLQLEMIPGSATVGASCPP